MSPGEVKLPYGTITDRKLVMHFSAFDMDLPIIASGIRERMDVLREIGVAFAGFGTEIPPNMSEQTPARVKAFFEYVGTGGDPVAVLKQAYYLVWSGMIQTFPFLEEWAEAKSNLSNLTIAQAEVIRARRGQ
ncbi:MAG: hypothetical protein ACTSVD_00355 [Candidatus Thorarchaeota archaeon]|nr:MAG: hypothetical protein DRO73_04260 [Candidatus Thorarchaeota archaeon]RLI61485.1 MAG: hypothetical protein DRO93_04085 [Candidatus Thorarchaeota archaeon]